MHVATLRFSASPSVADSYTDLQLHLLEIKHCKETGIIPVRHATRQILTDMFQESSETKTKERQHTDLLIAIRRVLLVFT